MKRAVALTLTEREARCIAVIVIRTADLARVREKLVEFGLPGFLVGIFTRKIPKLRRWQASNA